MQGPNSDPWSGKQMPQATTKLKKQKKQVFIISHDSMDRPNGCSACLTWAHSRVGGQLAGWLGAGLSWDSGFLSTESFIPTSL